MDAENYMTLQSCFRVELRNRYSELYSVSSNVTEQYDALVQANHHAAKATLPLVKKSKRKRYSNNSEVVKARKQVVKLERSYQKDQKVECDKKTSTSC